MAIARVTAHVAATVFLACRPAACTAGTIYVDAGLTTGADDGSSWVNAFRGPLGLRSALAAAQEGDEVWVADGRYVPGLAGSPRTTAFTVPSGVAVYGGFAGGETSLDSRRPEVFTATLSGDMAGNGNSPPTDNALHVVVLADCAQATVLDGFVVRDGVANGSSASLGTRGGGMLITGGAPTVRSCVFDASHASLFGGGIAVIGASPLVDRCVFRNNLAHSGVGIYHAEGSSATIRRCRFEGSPQVSGGTTGVGILSGGLLANSLPSFVTIEDCFFSLTVPQFSCPSGVGVAVWEGEADIRRCEFVNLHTCGGGAGVAGDGTVRIDRCRFIGNEATADGGAAIHSFEGDYTVTNCLFIGNDRQGFSTIQTGGRTRLINCTFFANGSASSLHAVFFPQSADFIVRNSIVWGNLSSMGESAAVALPNRVHLPAFEDCIVQGWNGGLPGDRTFAAEPFFVDGAGLDGEPGTNDDDTHLAAGSPAIDRGRNSAFPATIITDADGAPRRADVADTPDLGVGTRPIIDLGAFEAPGDTCDSVDFNGDGLFPDNADLEDFLSVFSGGVCSTGTCGDIDFNNDGLSPDNWDVEEFFGVFGGGSC